MPGCICNLAVNGDNRVFICSAGGIPALLHMIRTGGEGSREAAAKGEPPSRAILPRAAPRRWYRTRTTHRPPAASAPTNSGVCALFCASGEVSPSFTQQGPTRL